MKNKILIVAVLAIMLITFVSADNFAVSPTSITVTPAFNQSQFTVTNTNPAILLNLNVPTQVQITGEDNYIATFQISGPTTNVNASNPSVFKITPSGNIDFSHFNFEKAYSAKLNVSDGSTTTPVNLIIQNQFCPNGEVGNLRLTTDISNTGSIGTGTDWYPFEPINIDATVRNRGSDTINSVVVSWELYNKRTGQVIDSNDQKRFNLRDNSDKTISFNLTVDPANLDVNDNQNDYVFYVKAASDDLGENNQCSFTRDLITIPRDNHFITLGKFTMPSQAQCGDTISLGATAWNTGDNDEQDTYAIISSKDLGLNKRVDIGNIDMLNDKKFSFDYTIPKNLTEGIKTLAFKVYDQDGNIFETDDSSSQAVFTKTINVEGNCQVPQSVDLSTTLNSDAVAGKALQVKATVRNTGSASTTYVIDATGYDSWASDKSISPQSITLAAGESKDVIITLTPNNGASGNQDLTVQALYGNLVTKQTITVPVQASGFSLTGFSISNMFSGNWFIWAVAALNVILVILIIIIAVRIARK